MSDRFPNHHRYHSHRDVTGGAARAAVFGVSDGLVSNVALILGVAGAAVDGRIVLLTGLAGLIAGAVSMAAGEYVSMQAQRELVERELRIESESLECHPDVEQAELAAIYEARGLDSDTSRRIAEEVHRDPEVALEVHAKEELGVDPEGLGSPTGAAIWSFFAFAAGALIPLVPWMMTEGDLATIISIVLATVAAGVVGAVLSLFTGKSAWFSAARQVLIAAGASAATYAIGRAVGTTI